MLQTSPETDFRPRHEQEARAIRVMRSDPERRAIMLAYSDVNAIR